MPKTISLKKEKKGNDVKRNKNYNIGAHITCHQSYHITIVHWGQKMPITVHRNAQFFLLWLNASRWSLLAVGPKNKVEEKKIGYPHHHQMFPWNAILFYGELSNTQTSRKLVYVHVANDCDTCAQIKFNFHVASSSVLFYFSFVLNEEMLQRKTSAIS